MIDRYVLIEHQRPRIVAIDFSKTEVDRFRRSGFDVRAGTAGFKGGKFLIPRSVEDVEILLIRVQNNSFSKWEKRVADADSIEKAFPAFQTLMQEVWEKNGWVLLFVASDTHPANLEYLGFHGIGVEVRGRDYVSALDYYARIGGRFVDDPGSSALEFPRHLGDSVVATDEQPEPAIVGRYVGKAAFQVFFMGSHLGLFGVKQSPIVLLRQDASHRAALAFKIRNWDSVTRSIGGGIAVLPDFGDSTADVALALVKEVIANPIYSRAVSEIVGQCARRSL